MYLAVHRYRILIDNLLHVGVLVGVTAAVSRNRHDFGDGRKVLLTWGILSWAASMRLARRRANCRAGVTGTGAVLL